MLISFKAKNIIVFDEIEINFLISSKKIGKYVKDNDYIKIKNLKVQKKIGIIGANSSGKSSTLKAFLLFSYFFNIGNLYKFIYENSLFYLSNERFFKNINNSINVMDKNSSQEKAYSLHDFKVDENQLLIRIKENYENFLTNCFFNSNIGKIEFEIKFIYKKEIIIGKYLIDKNGFIDYSFWKENKKIYFKKINFYEIGPYTNTKLTYENWELNFLQIPFEQKFDFAILNSADFPTSSNNRAILNSIFDYTRTNGKLEHFLKWVKIADSSVNNLISDAKNKIFNIQKENGETMVIDNLSLGTKKWIVLYFFLFVAIKKSDEVTNIIIYDEIENSFHNKLISALFTTFDEKSDNSQLVFSSHNPEIFDKTFKHDGIYLSEYDKNMCSLVRLDKCKLKKDISFRSFYLNEKIGYHPDDQAILDFYDEK